MKLQTLLDRFPDSFHEALEDVNWSSVAKAMDAGDALLVSRLLSFPLEAMADAKEDELPRDTREDDAYERRWPEHYLKVNNENR